LLLHTPDTGGRYYVMQFVDTTVRSSVHDRG
jgi:hypothetical protein